MTALANGSNITRYAPEQQGSGTFDDGKITEIKPISFPQEYGGARSIGPLFYWSWATANGGGVIPSHPHQGFEILSYALEGEIGHSDSLGSEGRVGKGGVQVMRTASGVTHREEMFGERTEFFQIWFEPDLRKALLQQPTYADYPEEVFPRKEVDGVTIKTLIGEGSPVSLEAEVTLQDVFIEPEKTFGISLRHGRVIAAMTVEGQGMWLGMPAVPVGGRDFTVLQNEERFEARAGGGGMRLMIAEVPREVDYPVYSGR